MIGASSRDVRDPLVAGGADIIASTPDEFLAHLKIETDKWAQVMREADIRAD